MRKAIPIHIKKVIQAEPYSIEYILLDVISKEKKDKDKEINATNT